MNINHKKLSVKDAFKNYYYIVPAYQREYVWSENNVEQLLDDIFDEYNNGGKDSEYFIGSIILSLKEDGVIEDRVCEIIDGQQRLTTLFITLCAFKNKFAALNDHEKAKTISEVLFSIDIDSYGENVGKRRLELQYENSENILGTVMDGDLSSAEFTGSSENITKAYMSALRFMEEKLKETDLSKFCGYFLNKVCFMQIEATSVEGALKIFETVNDRGVGLSPIDLLKNLIFQQQDSKKFEMINSEWRKIIEKLNDKRINKKRKPKPLRFLKYFIMANYQVRDGGKNDDVIREDEIYSWIKRNDFKCNYKNNPLGFVKKIEDNVDSYNSYLNANTLDKRLDVVLENIMYLGGNAFSQHLVLLLAAKKLPLEIRLHLSKQIEKLIFYYFVTKTQAKVLESRFSRWADEIRSIEKSDDKVKALNSFLEESFVAEQKRLENDFENMFLDLRIDSMQRYKIKYILAKIAQYIEMKRIGQKTEPTGLNEYLKQEVELEHILPDKPENELINCFGGEDKYNVLKSKLGNITLLEKPLNIVAGRGFYDEKKKVYVKSNIHLTKTMVNKEDVGKDTSVERINNRLLSFDRWSEKEINDRQKMLYDLASIIWKIDYMRGDNKGDGGALCCSKKRSENLDLGKKDDYVGENTDNEKNFLKGGIDFTGRRPEYFKFLSEKIFVSSWIDLYTGVIKLIYEEKLSIFSNEEINIINGSRNRHVIEKNTKVKEINGRTKEIEFSDGNFVSVQSCLSVQDLQKELSKIFETCKIKNELLVKTTGS